jgi:hypothetical protein
MHRSGYAWIVAVGVLSACGSPGPASQDKAPTAAPAASPAPATAAIGAAQALNVTRYFPDGPGRSQVLDTCGSCHPVACSARGQRTAAQWDRIREGHADKLTSVSRADMDALFSYLKTNFNDTKPEPQIPAELLQPGCTPF